MWYFFLWLFALVFVLAVAGLCLHGPYNDLLSDSANTHVMDIRKAKKIVLSNDPGYGHMKHSESEVVKKAIAIRDREEQSFQAYQRCPQCGEFGFWLMKEDPDVPLYSFLTRICGRCKHEWRQT